MTFNRDSDRDKIDISELQNVTITLGDLRAILTLLEHATTHLLLDDEANAALERLRKATQCTS